MSKFTNAVVSACTVRSIHTIIDLAGLGKSLNSVLFDAWSQCAGNWSRSKFLMNIRERHSSRRRGVRKWLFAHQMDEVFGKEVAEGMRERKRMDPDLWESETRFHPECPQQEARLFFFLK